MRNERKIVGVFHTEQEAINAVDGLKRQGYRADQISVIAKDRGEMSSIIEETGTRAPEGAATGAITGGTLGSVGGILLGMGALAIPGIGPFIAAGPIVAGLTGLAAGAGTGALVGGLIGLGIPEEEAKKYNDYLDDGHILVMVDSNTEWDTHTYNTFRTNNSMNANTYEGDYADIGRDREISR
jgi:hypothetical protein